MMELRFEPTDHEFKSFDLPTLLNKAVGDDRFKQMDIK